MTLAAFTVNPFDIAKHWVTYTLSDTTDSVQFIGYCKAANLLSFPDARSYSLFEQVFGTRKQAILTILGFGEKVHQVQNIRSRWIAEHGFPLINKKSMPVDGRQVAIYCVETSEQFRSMRDACETHGINPSNMSNHLKRRKGNKTCRGKTYQLGYAPVFPPPNQPPPQTFNTVILPVPLSVGENND